ncbi:hypothetical protein BWI17_14225 [Betaproteobacteria bacterium GR16-43]|nr:hypothetical protein BWI17_14225 [Betaproteobacteria bacterium GR16-43]
MGIAACISLYGVGALVGLLAASPIFAGGWVEADAEAIPTAIPAMNEPKTLIISMLLMALVTELIRARSGVDLVNIQHFACRPAETPRRSIVVA